jgi:hypothetical protein
MRNLPDFSAIQGSLAVALHDAGAANLVIGWLKSGQITNVRAHVGGPAEMLWHKAFPQLKAVSLNEALSSAVALLSGTGWASSLEYDAMSAAKGLGIPTFAVIDHWVNYHDRFVRNGIEVIPNEVWVSDHYALAEARKQLPNIYVREFENSYLWEQVNSVLNLRPAIEKTAYQTRVLYTLEPIRLSWDTNDKRPGEFQALDYFMSRLGDLGLKSDCQIRLRPHPSDSSKKYDEWISNTNFAGLHLAPDESIANAIAWADIVAGCESFALLIGLETGRKVVSTLPPWGNKIRLPHKGIIRLCEI